jgi:uncharacterized protein (DUF1800 family)
VTTRRAFLAGTLLAALSTRLAWAATPATGADLWLNRLTFGATPETRARFAALGPKGWLEEQIALPARDAGLDARLAAQRLRIAYAAGDNGEGGTWGAVDELRPLATLDAPPESLLPLIDWTLPMAFDERARPAEEVVAASLVRAVHAPAQLREVMTQFWHDHLNVHAQKDEYTAVFFPAYDATLRDRALGNFRDLLGAVAASPAMLYYLNNADSRASPANENYARELLELHTLGAAHYLNDRHTRWHEVPKDADGIAVGYIDEDVYEVARAFTGWTVGDGRWLAEGVEAPRTGRFHYTAAWHDPYQKRILGVEFPPNRAALADGNDVLDLLARHPGTARFVCGKIARRFISDDPDPALVERLAAVFLANAQAPDQIAQVLRALVAEPAFAAPPPKLRRPFEFLAALYRATGAEVTGTENGWRWQLSRAGWHQHGFPPPTGHPDRAEDWQGTTTLLRLVEFALYAHDDWFGATSSRLSGEVPAKIGTPGALARHWSERLTGTPDPMAEALAAIGVLPDDPLPRDETSRHDLSAVAVAFAALTPAFVFR